MELFGIEFTILQVALVFALLLVGPLGFYNMKRRKRLKAQDESMFENFNSHTVEEGPGEDDAESQQIISYITSYKDQYSKESITSALLNNGNNPEKVSRLVDRYY